MKSHTTKNWLCTKCGYLMNTATHACGPDKDKPPEENDITMCLACGELYSLHDDEWTATTPQELESLPPELRSFIEGAREATRRFCEGTELYGMGVGGSA